jgi:hypothetical protein
MQDCLEDFNVLVIMTPWKDFSEIKIPSTVSSEEKLFIVDPYGCLNSNELINENTKYYKLGQSVR